MSLNNIDITMVRIEEATPESRIAVFRCWRPGHLDCIFADTVEGLQRISVDKDLIGVYDRNCRYEDVYNQLRIEINR